LQHFYFAYSSENVISVHQKAILLRKMKAWMDPSNPWG
jgi:hypothetical protein